MKRVRRNRKEVVTQETKVRRVRKKRPSAEVEASPAMKSVTETFLAPDRKAVKQRLKWKPEFLRIIYHMALLGAKEKDICTALGVQPNAMAVWKRTRAGVNEVLREGKMIADAKMAESLYHVGTGYSHPETKIIPNRVKTFNEKGKLIKDELKIERVDVVKHYPPNVTAATKWLKARHPELWGEQSNEINSQVININTINYADFSNQELEVLAKMGLQQKGIEAPKVIAGAGGLSSFDNSLFVDDGELIIDDEEEDGAILDAGEIIDYGDE